MSHRFFDHTADVGVDLRAPSRDALFAEALRAFTDTLVPLDRLDTGAEAIEREISLTAESLDELMVAWLEELLYLFEVDSLLFSGADVRVEEGPGKDPDSIPDMGLDAGRFRLHATARGELYDPGRHPLKVLIKGVTYHELTVEETSDGWRARVIFDI